ncbi:hypothetical protein CWRG_00371 [Chthonomonas calidirosea]|uniref:hypothetical protein n=1 Tax=Chthonomonas calidirosea TaxID=454171 RepID=UPI0006DD4B85|nr:hypothetical protein [Chthonomonas calidirosea]CEK13124.1 hypothetical protein CWRG_00371 [Chthonomonas calidirosea]
MRILLGKIALSIIPALLAGWAVSHQVLLMAWSRTHATLLPIVLVLVLSALLIAALRRILIITFCYAIAFLSYYTYRLARPLPPGLNYEWVLTVRALMLELVMILALTAAILEAFRPNTSWARRSYFAAVGLYFTGMGIRTYLWSHEMRSLLLIVTGIAALIASLVGRDDEPQQTVLPTSSPSPAEAVVVRKTRRLKEWTETPPSEEPTKMKIL